MEPRNFTAIKADFRHCYSNEIVTYLERRLDGDLKINNILLAIVNSILALCGSFSNLFVIFTYLRARDPSMKRLSNMLIVVLAYNDLVVTALLQPLFVLRKGYFEIHGIENCVLFGIFRLGMNFSCGISAMTVITVTTERYIAIARPYLYPVLITRGRLKAIISVLWTGYLFIVCSRIWFLPLFVLPLTMNIIAAVFIISTFSMWTHILILTQRHAKAMKRQLAGVQILKQYKENYSIDIACIIVVSTILCYTPILVMTIYGSLYVMDFPYLYTFLPWAETLVFFNSFANSVIFTWREKKFRIAFYYLFRAERSSIAPAFAQNRDLNGEFNIRR